MRRPSRRGISSFSDSIAAAATILTPSSTKQFRSIEKTLAEFGLTLAHLVKVHVWLKRIEDLPSMEKRFGRTFAQDEFSGPHDRPPPSLSTMTGW